MESHCGIRCHYCGKTNFKVSENFHKNIRFFCEIFKLIFQGMRVKCAECPNYEICSNCYALLKVAPGGVFVVQYDKIYIILFLFNYLRRYIL